MMNTLAKPWCTRGEAAEYLRFSIDTVDRLLVPFEKGAVAGKMRFTRVVSARPSSPVRIASVDVLELLPVPEEVT